jgi:hypothetical protein
VRPDRRATSRPRPRGKTGAGGVIGPFQPSPAQLLATLPLPGGLGRGQRPQSVTLQSGLVQRGPVQVNAIDSLPGFRWDLPAPEWGRRVAWAAIWFDWQFWRWYSASLKNNGSHGVHVDGGVDWRWVLTGNPFFFPDPPILMEDAGHFTFETFIVPGGDGYDAGWLVPPKGETYLPGPAPSPLGHLLGLRVDNVLRLWFGVDLRNPTLHFSGPLSGSGGWAMGGGPNTLYYQYAYVGSALPTDWDAILVEQAQA